MYLAARETLCASSHLLVDVGDERARLGDPFSGPWTGICRQHGSAAPGQPSTPSPPPTSTQSPSRTPKPTPIHTRYHIPLVREPRAHHDVRTPALPAVSRPRLTSALRTAHSTHPTSHYSRRPRTRTLAQQRSTRSHRRFPPRRSPSRARPTLPEPTQLPQRSSQQPQTTPAGASTGAGRGRGDRSNDERTRAQRGGSPYRPCQTCGTSRASSPASDLSFTASVPLRRPRTRVRPTTRRPQIGRAHV